jgi:hypothetical protein
MAGSKVKKTTLRGSSRYKAVLKYSAGNQAAAEPLYAVMVKKSKGAVIEKNIGAISRAENIIAYKSLGGCISAWDFYRVYGCACLYAAVNRIPLTGISLTFVGSRYPKELVSRLEEDHGLKVEHVDKGIYTVKGGAMPIQIIESRQLSAEKNPWLKSLDNNLGAEDIRWILSTIARMGSAGQSGAYEAITEANPESARKALKMGDTSLTLEKVFEEAGLIAKWEAKGEKRGEVKAKREVAKKALLRGLPEKTVTAITGLKESAVRNLAAGNKKNKNGPAGKTVGKRKSAAKT